ncbi:MAG: hypothetical protein AAGE61_00845 [Pseudomonadota bacterium]
MARTLPVILLSLLFLTAQEIQTHAADVRLSEHKLCAVELSGEIEPGDLVKLKGLAEQLDLIYNWETSGPESNEFDERLCLNSPGGSYAEGRDIMAFVHENGIGTYIPAGSRCFSACAFIFMSGYSRGREYHFPSRWMHPKGFLGFHAPYFKLPTEQTYSNEDVEDYARLATLIVSDLIQFGRYWSREADHPGLPASLIQELLAAGPTEMVLVDTVEEIALWGIKLSEIRDASNFTNQDYVQACLNFLAWSKDRRSSGYQSATEPFGTFVGSAGYGEPLKYNVINVNYYRASLNRWAQTCYIEYSEEPLGGYRICSVDYDGSEQGDCIGNHSLGAPRYVPWYWGLEPDYPISKLGNLIPRPRPFTSSN